jgi:hypothetical protein
MTCDRNKTRVRDLMTSPITKHCKVVKEPTFPCYLSCQCASYSGISFFFFSFFFGGAGGGGVGDGFLAKIENKTKSTGY